MANSYRTWAADTEQDWVTRMDSFLTNVVGWYRAYTYSDTSSDREYAWISEGESDDSRPVRIIRIQGQLNDIRLDCALADNYNFSTGDIGSPYLGSASTAEIRNMTSPGRCRVVASKNRACMLMETSSTSRYSGYVGYITSFYSPIDDPEPIFIRTQISTAEDWTGTGRLRGLRFSDNTEVDYSMFFAETMVNEGYPNPRNGEFSFFSPIVYYDGSPSDYEVRGRLDGIYYGKADRLGFGSFVLIGSDYYLVTKTSDEEDAILFGPVTDDGTIPQDVIDLGFPSFPTLYVEYEDRGLEDYPTSSGTFALWRFDTGQLDGYVYGSGDTLPTPTTYEDSSGSYDLTPQNSLVSVESRLNEAADFDGSTQYATAAGHANAVTDLTGEWTFDCVFKPDAIPTGGSIDTILSYGAASSASEDDNTLFSVSIVPASGTTPNAYNVELGNIKLEWEKNVSEDIVYQTSSDFIQQDRWNYLAVTKTYNGSNYDLAIWHCSFGDHLVPEVKATASGIDNATGGTNSSWFVGTDHTTTNYFDGQLDDTRLTARPLSQSEIEDSCLRAML